MADCAKCGYELGLGRYCTNCGQPVDDPAADPWRTDTAERPAAPLVPPPAPPPAWTPPPAPRYPLFADEVDPVDPVGPVDPVDRPLPVAHPDEHVAPLTQHRRSRPWALWIAAAAVLALVAVLGVWFFTGDDSTTPTADGDPTSTPSASGDDKAPSKEPDTGTPAGLTAASKVTVPATAKPNQDVNGNPVSYAGTNMLDGVPETCWRMPGDGSGEEIVIALPKKTRLRSVGLINGYAKQEKGRDWYHGNRRVQKVEWVFDDGTTLPQDLGDTTAVQSIDVDVTTTRITLRLVAVSKPGKGADARDFTAISDLLFVAR